MKSYTGITVKFAKEYNIWRSMIHRCSARKNTRWKDYGGRGITVHPDFLNFSYFLGYVGARPTDKHTLDRINNDGNYEPGNVRWADQRTQRMNRSDNFRITHNKTTKTLTEWSELLNISVGTLWARLKSYKWSVDEALFRPVMGSGQSRRYSKH